jgi:methyl-accepting chemotaxis protein
MIRNKLSTALMITLAMLAGVFYFDNNNSPLSSGQAITLCLGALAWIALILTSSLQSQQNHPLTASPASNIDGLPNSITELLGTFQAELNQQINATEAELTQVKSIMDNAIDDLVDSFISLEASARIEQKLVMLLASSENVKDNDELNPFREKQLHAKRYLLETADKLNNMIADAQQNEAACKSLGNIEKIAEQDIEKLEAALDKLAQTADSKQVGKIRDSAKALHTALTKANKVVAKLHASSQILTEESRDISHKVTAIISENANNIAMVTDEMAVTAAQIEVDVQTAVKSLQFQDMTTQLIVQCGERQKIMQHILSVVDGISKEGNSKATVSELQTKLMTASNELKLASNVRMKQFNVDAGSVELF